MMPDLDGWTVLAAIKGDPALASIPVVLMSIVDQKNRGYALGAADYLIKPVDRAKLVETLTRICGASAGLSTAAILQRTILTRYWSAWGQNRHFRSIASRPLRPAANIAPCEPRIRDTGGSYVCLRLTP
jgi:DNA-binding response OmpR family regulator